MRVSIDIELEVAPSQEVKNKMGIGVVRSNLLYSFCQHPKPFILFCGSGSPRLQSFFVFV